MAKWLSYTQLTKVRFLVRPQLWTLDAGRWMLDTGRRILDIRYWKYFNNFIFASSLCGGLRALSRPAERGGAVWECKHKKFAQTAFAIWAKNFISFYPLLLCGFSRSESFDLR